MRKLPLSQGLVTLIDDDDHEWLDQWKWHAKKTRCGWNAVRRIRGKERRDRRSHYVIMHRELLRVPRDKQVDHINGNRLDNRKCNLRICTTAQNKCNSPIYKNNKSGYKGVVYQKPFGDDSYSKSWRAFIQINGKRKALGYFATPEEAAEAYDKAATRHYGEFALTNKSLGLLN